MGLVESLLISLEVTRELFSSQLPDLLESVIIIVRLCLQLSAGQVTGNLKICVSIKVWIGKLSLC